MRNYAFSENIGDDYIRSVMFDPNGNNEFYAQRAVAYVFVLDKDVFASSNKPRPSYTLHWLVFLCCMQTDRTIRLHSRLGATECHNLHLNLSFMVGSLS